MTTVYFLLGLFLGGAIGYFACALTTMAQQADITAACHQCHYKHMQALMRAGVDTRWAA
jgi:hypothetical protein